MSYLEILQRPFQITSIPPAAGIRQGASTKEEL